MKIDEPKTPYNDEYDELEGTGEGEAEDVVMKDQTEHVPSIEDIEIKKHLEEAERNKLLNAQLALL